MTLFVQRCGANGLPGENVLRNVDQEDRRDQGRVLSMVYLVINVLVLTPILKIVKGLYAMNVMVRELAITVMLMPIVPIRLTHLNVNAAHPSMATELYA